MADLKLGSLPNLDTQVERALAAAQSLKSNAGLAALASLKDRNNLAVSISNSLTSHSQYAINVFGNWQTSASDDIRSQIIFVIQMAEQSIAVLSTIFKTAGATEKLAGISTKLDQANSKLQGCNALISNYNSIFTKINTGLKSDSINIANKMKADTRKYKTLQNQLAQYNKEHKVSAKHVCEEFGKALISFGGWAIADAVNAQKELHRIDSGLNTLNVEVPALESLERPLDDLLTIVASVENELGNATSAADEASNSLKSLINDKKTLPDKDDFWFQPAVNDLIEDLKGLLKRVRYIVNTEEVWGVCLFPKSANLKWLDVTDLDLKNTFQPPLTDAQLDDFKWWSQAAARWGIRHPDANGQSYLTGLPTYEVGNKNGAPVRGIMLVSRELGAVWKDVTDQELIATFPAGFLSPQLLNQPRYWAAAVNRWATAQTDPLTNEKYVCGIPTWEVGSHHKPVRGVLLFPKGSGIVWRSVATVELAHTFDPRLPHQVLSQERYWASAAGRWAFSHGFGFGVPSWEVGREELH